MFQTVIRHETTPGFTLSQETLKEIHNRIRSALEIRPHYMRGYTLSIDSANGIVEIVLPYFHRDSTFKSAIVRLPQGFTTFRKTYRTSYKSAI